jgi:hypothetical protein
VVSVSLVAQWKEYCYINCYPFKQCPNVVLVHLNPILGLWIATGSTGVTLSAPFFNIASCLKPVEPLPDFIQGFVDTQVTS